jgi:hypothetical protein
MYTGHYLIPGSLQGIYYTMIAASILHSSFQSCTCKLQFPIQSTLKNPHSHSKHGWANQNAQFKPYKLSVVAELKRVWNYAAQRPNKHEYWDLSKDIPSEQHTLSRRK